MRFKTLCLVLTLALLVSGSVPVSAGVWSPTVDDEGSSVIEGWLPWQGMEGLLQDLLQTMLAATGNHGYAGGNAGGNSADGGGSSGGGQGTTNPPPPGGDGVGTQIDPNGFH
jgi:uncharacterized membrane protein YgcG